MLFLQQLVHRHHSVHLVLNSKLERAISNHSFVRILLVDDYAPWRRFIIAKLRASHNLRIVGVVSDGLEAVVKAEELQPDLVLLDVGLPKISGIEAARRIRKVSPKSKILFLSHLVDVDVARIALTEGAHGYMVKSDAQTELFAAVDAITLGKKYVSRRLASPEFADYVSLQTNGTSLRDDAFAPSAESSLLRREVARCHEVQFYSDDTRFVDGFARFISGSLKAGRASIFLGNASHRHALLERLHTESPDSRAAIREGRYIPLDAEEFLSNFMVEDMPEPDRFFKFTKDLVSATAKRATGEHLPLAACGECASILWANGKADAAIRLEELWNEIARTYDIDTLCGYSLDSLRFDEDSYTFRRICEEHSAVHSW